MDNRLYLIYFRLLFGFFHSFQNAPLFLEKIGHYVNRPFCVFKGTDFLLPLIDELISELNPLFTFFFYLILLLNNLVLMCPDPNVMLKLQIGKILNLKVLNYVVSRIIRNFTYFS